MDAAVARVLRHIVEQQFKAQSAVQRYSGRLQPAAGNVPFANSETIADATGLDDVTIVNALKTLMDARLVIGAPRVQADTTSLPTFTSIHVLLPGYRAYELAISM